LGGYKSKKHQRNMSKTEGLRAPTLNTLLSKTK
jgi:hypothetical protein